MEKSPKLLIIYGIAMVARLSRRGQGFCGEQGPHGKESHITDNLRYSHGGEDE